MHQTAASTSGVGLAGSVRGLVGVGAASILDVMEASSLGLGGGVGIGVGVGVAADGIWFKMRPRSARYHALTCSSIVDMSAAIKNARSVFHFVTLVLRRSRLTSCFIINADHRALDFSSLLAPLFLASAMHCSIEDCSRSAAGAASLAALALLLPSGHPSAAAGAGASG